MNSIYEFKISELAQIVYTNFKVGKFSSAFQVFLISWWVWKKDAFKQ